MKLLCQRADHIEGLGSGRDDDRVIPTHHQHIERETRKSIAISRNDLQMAAHGLAHSGINGFIDGLRCITYLFQRLQASKYLPHAVAVSVDQSEIVLSACDAA